MNSTQDLDLPVPFDLERIKASIESGVISFPSGLTREERRAYVRERLRELDANSKKLIVVE